jgi:hypothetical protein
VEEISPDTALERLGLNVARQRQRGAGRSGHRSFRTSSGVSISSGEIGVDSNTIAPRLEPHTKLESLELARSDRAARVS